MESTIVSILSGLRSLHDDANTRIEDKFAEIESLEQDKETKGQAPAVKAELKQDLQNRKDLVKAIELVTAVKIRLGE